LSEQDPLRQVPRLAVEGRAGSCPGLRLAWRGCGSLPGRCWGGPGWWVRSTAARAAGGDRAADSPRRAGARLRCRPAAWRGVAASRAGGARRCHIRGGHPVV